MNEIQNEILKRIDEAKARGAMAEIDALYELFRDLSIFILMEGRNEQQQQ